MKRRLVWIFCVALLTFGGTRLAAQVDARALEAVRSTVDEWVKTKQLTADEKAEWRVEKESLQQSISLIEKEIQLIAEQIANATETATESDRQRATLVEENERLTQAADTIQQVVKGLEARVVTLSKAFPEPLKVTVKPLLKRIPNEAAVARRSLSDRMMNVVGILNEVDKFNQLISLTTEVREAPSGEQVEVKTVYLGISLAFFSDKTGTFGGVGLPGSDGWQWTTANELAPDIARSIAMYENRETAAFVTLPVTIQ